MTDILLIGRNGQLGHELLARLAPRYDVLAMSSADLDVTNAEATRAAIAAAAPALVINTTAYTAVDRAESEPAAAYAVNAEAPAVMAASARDAGAGLLHFSTDFVFDGRGDRPYVEDDPTAPLNVYGASKRVGEVAIQSSGAACMTFRTSWLYATRGSNFLLTISRLLRERDVLSVVSDQTGTPTAVAELARLVCAILPDSADALPDFVARHAGLYHLSCEGAVSWFDFAAAIRERLAARGERVGEVRPIPSSEYKTPAARPAYSVLDKAKFRQAFDLEPAAWDAALGRAFDSMDGMRQAGEGDVSSSA